MRAWRNYSKWGKYLFKVELKFYWTPDFKRHFIFLFSDYFLNFEKIKLFFNMKQRKNVLIGQKIRENSASFFVKTLRELNSYLVKLQLYKCGIWKSWTPSWNRTNLLSRQSETLVIMISFNFSHKGSRQFMDCQFFNHFLNFHRNFLVKLLMYKDSNASCKRVLFHCEIEQIFCHDKVKHC